VQHGEAQQVAAQQHRAQWELDVVEKARLARMTDEVDAFREQIVTRRAEEFRALKVGNTTCALNLCHHTAGLPSKPYTSAVLTPEVECALGFNSMERHPT